MTFFCGSSPSTDPVEARQKIDEEIYRLKAEIVALKTARNTYSPFTRLHPEIAQEIFRIATRDTNHGMDVSKSVFRLTWVCQHWRELIQGLSALWDYIDTIEQKWTYTALYRTRGRPVTLSFNFERGYQGDADSIMVVCARYTAVIKRLTLRQHSLEDCLDLSLFWILKFKSLTSLVLRNVAIPYMISSREFPVLEKLSLFGCYFDWESLPIRSSLKTLAIGRPTEPTSVDVLLSKLYLIGSGLEELRIADTLMPTESFDEPIHAPSKPRMELPNLKFISIDERHAPSVAFILNRLSFPSDLRKIEVSLHGGPDQLEAVQALASCRGIPNWSVNYIEVELEGNQVKFDIRENWRFRHEGVHFGISEDDSDNRPQPTQILLNLEAKRWISNIVMILNGLPITLTSSYISFKGASDKLGAASFVDWFDIRGVVHSINISISFTPIFSRILRIQNQELRQLLGRVGKVKSKAITDEIRAKMHEIIPFHQLTALRYYGDGEGSDLLESRHFRVLQEWLRWRRHAGLGLRVLRFDMHQQSEQDYIYLYSQTSPVDRSSLGSPI